MFDRIAGTYDLLNHLLSFGIDLIWRRRVLREVKRTGAERALDVATGTGDLAIGMAKSGVPSVLGIDISQGMLEKGKKKIEKRELGERVRLEQGDAEFIEYPDGSFDVVTVAFGVRNFQDLERGLQEMKRVLRPGGELLVLEFSRPHLFPIKQLFGLYFRYLVPLIGKFMSRDRSAYSYLPASVSVFPEGQAFVDILCANGYGAVRMTSLTGGIATLYRAKKE